jgi:phosphatidate phosphatase LPIN
LREIKQLFIEPDCDENPFFAGFGNKATDALAYSSVGIPQDRVYIINPRGVIYKFGTENTISYPKLNEQIDELFPLREASNIDHKIHNNPLYWKNKWGDSYEMSVLEEFQNKPK